MRAIYGVSGPELKEVLQALYPGHGWQVRAAEALGVDTSTIRRWASGQVTVPGPVVAAVKCFQRGPR